MSRFVKNPFAPKILFEGESDFSREIRVIDSGGVRKLLVDSYVQSVSLNSSGKVTGYWNTVMEIVQEQLKNPKKILILGLGGGTLVKLFNNKFQIEKIDGVEVDPKIVEIAKNYFWLSDPNLNIKVGDAINYVRRKVDDYDAIMVDLYLGGNLLEATGKQEFFENLAKNLKKGGLVMLNRIYDFASKEKTLEAYHLLKRVFGNSNWVQAEPYFKSNNIILYSIKN
ncbi:MAG: hypothetical protein A2Y57_01945 [Candidatus Woykebacteria bacterium RBG_13_40_7b]|uniref:PABS domain-containing protein n=1 Tax=Candidatus Woykebacteria bacterium RBG_13_40_7b TaxID=1802594 RepID=A0A1G1WA67_9BACT|nr:MAG: hypothetical protein A2Y57_01945 [Candidatus Woykebacteria bacterium RBG_13_40_7b]